MIIHSQLELCEDSLQTLELRGVVLVSKVVKGCVMVCKNHRLYFILVGCLVAGLLAFLSMKKEILR